MVSLLAFPNGLRAQEHVLFSRLLKANVSKASVNYRALKKSPLLKRYIQQLEKTNPDKIKGRNKQLAFWINAYNAYTLKLITDHYPIKSISELHLGGNLVIAVMLGKTVWRTWKFKINNKEYTLDKIEHEIIRKKFNEPLIHAALVCAAKSCPPLRSQAYEGAKLNKQLSNQMRVWLADKKLNYFNKKEKKLYLSKIFKWFKDDFTQKNKFKLVSVLLPYLPAKTRNEIKKLGENNTNIGHLDYDWSLNGLD